MLVREVSVGVGLLVFTGRIAIAGPSTAPQEEPGLPKPVREEIRKVDQRRRTIDTAAMVTLGTWGVVNLGVGLWGDLSQPDGPERYFHQMNWMWGAVNGAIASVGLVSALSGELETDYKASLAKARQTELVFLINGVLDLSYMSVGAWLWERGLRTDEPILEGYGQSLVVQGGFLFLFDGIMFFVRRTVTSDLESLPVQMVPTPTGLALVGRF